MRRATVSSDDTCSLELIPTDCVTPWNHGKLKIESGGYYSVVGDAEHTQYENHIDFPYI